MSKEKLLRFDAEQAAIEQERIEKEKQLELKRAVRAVIPKGLRNLPKRPRGRTASGGVSRREVRELTLMAADFLNGEEGLRRFEAKVQLTALVSVLIDGLLGTEPWRAAAGPHGPIVAANARIRYMENAIRILEDMRKRSGAGQGKLTDGVFDQKRGEAPVDAEYTVKKEEKP